MQRAMKEQSENPEVLAQSAAAMKNMTPEDMEKLIAQMEGMPASERESLKKMGMDPDTSEWTRARAPRRPKFPGNTRSSPLCLSAGQHEDDEGQPADDGDGAEAHEQHDA